jgi:hypothetical protein
LAQTVPAETEIAAGHVTAQSLPATPFLATVLLATALDFAPALELTIPLGLAIALTIALELAFALDLTTTLDLTTLDLAFTLKVATMTAHIEIASDTISAAPTLPAMSTAPAKAAARTVTTPVPAGALPAAVIPTVAPPAKNELSVFDHVESISRDSEAAGRTKRCSLGTLTHEHPAGKKGGCRSERESNVAHDFSPWI